MNKFRINAEKYLDFIINLNLIIFILKVLKRFYKLLEKK